MRIFACLFFAFFSLQTLQAQDTYSIVAVDAETEEVGSAGASCVDLGNFGLDADFLGELFPALGAINTQAWYLPGNQASARNRMEAGDTPQQIIDYVIANDVQGDSTLRQYGVVGLVDGMAQAAAHTGSNTDDYKSHRVGDNYSIQGNILLGDFILDAMEDNFNNTDGMLAEKLMAALQGANVIGADTRCASNGTSALFSFLKVAQPADEFGSPSLVLGVITEDGDGIEPVDSLQTLFNEWLGTTSSTSEVQNQKLKVFPNPTTNNLEISLNLEEAANLNLFSISGELLYSQPFSGQENIDLSSYPAGVYVLQLRTKSGRVMLARVVKD
ncbi:MAG: DUF1028 domain-containing protein [Bacteroidetes bacterium]|nr:DUF1028 domain-containing protein [Bacteroidota bacterium]